MSFADWKKNSRLFRAFIDLSDLHGVGLEECCRAAYKAGERQGRKDAEEMAIRAIELARLSVPSSRNP